MITLTCEATDAQRRDVLDDLAHRWDRMPESARSRMLCTVTALRGKSLQAAWKDLREAIYDADAIEREELNWRQYEPGLTGEFCDRQHGAWLLACSQVDTAMRALLRDPVVQS